MSDAAPTTTPPAGAPAADTSAPTPPPPAGDAGRRSGEPREPDTATSAELETLRREQAAWKADQDELKKLRDEKLSDTERSANELNDAKTRAEKAETQLLRFQVADTKKLPAGAAEHLVGSTKEELEASADALLKLLGTTPAGDRKPDRTLGAGGEPTGIDPEAWLREQARR